MKTLLEMLALILLIAVILCLAFLFHGSPDIWDVMHAKVMASGSAK